MLRYGVMDTTPNSESPEISVPPSSANGHRWLLVGTFAAVIAIFVLIVSLLLPQRTGVQQASQQSQTSPSPSTIPTPTPEPSFSIVLMGRGGAGHDGGALTDTIVIAKILLESKRVLLLSVPRDLYVDIPYDGSTHFGKLNSAYAIGIDSKNYSSKREPFTGPNGGGELAKSVLSTVTGLQLDRYMVLDFSGFEQAIDLIGGVDVTVDRAFVDYEYPISGRERLDCASPIEKTATTPTSLQDEISAGTLDPTTLPKLSQEFPCRYEALRFAAGEQHLSGPLALKYVRSRHSSEEGSDFARSNRQKKLMVAVVEKIFSLNQIAKLPSFVSTLRSHIDTDFSASDWVTWIPKAPAIKDYPITSLSLTDQNYLSDDQHVDKQYVLLPKAGQGNYQAIHNWIQSTENPAIPLRYPRIEILSSQQSASQSASISATLAEKFYPVEQKKFTATNSASISIRHENIASEVLETINTILPGIEIRTEKIKDPSSADIAIRLP